MRQTGLVAKPEPVLTLDITRQPLAPDEPLDGPMWIISSIADTIYDPKTRVGTTFNRAPGSRLGSSAHGQGIRDSGHWQGGFVTIGQAILPEKMTPAKVTLRGEYVTLWDLTDEAKWDDRKTALAELAHASYALAVDTLSILQTGYRKALCVAQAACLEASAMAGACVQVKNLLHITLGSLEWADQDPPSCALALVSIEKGNALAEVRIMAVMRHAEKKVRDVMAWRVQMCAPIESRDGFIACARASWRSVGLVLNDKSLGKLLHAHRQEVQKAIPWCWQSETQRQTRARGGKMRPARNRVQNFII